MPLWTYLNHTCLEVTVAKISRIAVCSILKGLVLLNCLRLSRSGGCSTIPRNARRKPIFQWRAVLKSYSADTWPKIGTGRISRESSTIPEAEEEKQEAKKEKQVSSLPQGIRGIQYQQVVVVLEKEGYWKMGGG